ncbi:MAG: hypothetical protein ACKVOS_06915 [Sphingorhabdus sp.]|uniref:hypothetical protein n=1 Tax=Sphingorhabdus sp. TaxID=1902408 RepID=UPI0038FD2E15
MDHIFDFVRSELFLSLLGGFALGVAGLAMVDPANANSNETEATGSIVVGASIHEEIASPR